MAKRKVKKNQSDPRLLAAMSEIREIIDKFDIGAEVILVSKTNSEFYMGMPKWSLIQFEKNDRDDIPKDMEIVRFNSKSREYKNEKERQRAVEETIHVIDHLNGLSWYFYDNTSKIMAALHQKFDIANTTFQPEGKPASRMEIMKYMQEHYSPVAKAPIINNLNVKT